MIYEWIRHAHVALVALSVSGFLARGLGRLVEAAWVGGRFARVAPHVVDTLLLASGIALSVMSRQYPFEQGWLTAKLALLPVYIGLGMGALRFASGRRARAACLAGALAAAAAMVSLAIHKPW